MRAISSTAIQIGKLFANCSCHATPLFVEWEQQNAWQPYSTSDQLCSKCSTNWCAAMAQQAVSVLGCLCSVPGRMALRASTSACLLPADLLLPCHPYLRYLCAYCSVCRQAGEFPAKVCTCLPQMHAYSGSLGLKTRWFVWHCIHNSTC